MGYTCFGKVQDFRNEFPVNSSDAMVACVVYIAYIKGLKNEAGNRRKRRGATRIQSVESSIEKWIVSCLLKHF